MKVVVVVVALLAYASAICLDGTNPADTIMAFCTMYSGNTCCSNTTDLKTQALFGQSVVPRFGTDGCAQNIKRQMCAAACDPNQGLIADVTFNAVAINETFYVSQYWADGLYDSCKARCLSGVQTVQQLYPTSNAFVATFNTFLYPEYNDTTNVVTTVGVKAATQMNFNETAGPASGNDTTPCPAQCLNPNSPYSIARPMTFCLNYANGSCCNSTQETSLSTNYQAKVTALFGTDGCAQNIKTLYCFWACGPQQAKVSSLARGFPADNQTVYVSTAFANALWNSCKGRCLTQLGITWEQNFQGSPNAPFAFISQFNSDNDNNYKPDNRGNPRITYMIGTNPVTGSNVDSPLGGGSGADLTGCKAASSSSTTSKTSAGSALAPVLLAIVALVAALL